MLRPPDYGHKCAETVSYRQLRAHETREDLVCRLLLEKKHPDLTLLIVGECYEDISYYEDIIKEMGIEDKTILVNKFIANENIEPYFKASDMVVLPYNSATQSGILMMAYGLKVPVVANNVGGLPELIVEGKTGTVIPQQHSRSNC